MRTRQRTLTQYSLTRSLPARAPTHSSVVAGTQRQSWHVTCEFATAPPWAATRDTGSAVSHAVSDQQPSFRAAAALLRDGGAFLVSLHPQQQHPAVGSACSLEQLLRSAAGVGRDGDAASLDVCCPWLLPCLGVLALPTWLADAYIHPCCGSHTLESVLRFSPAALASEQAKRLLLYQLCSGLADWHDAAGGETAHGAVHPGSVRLGDQSPSAAALAPPLACWPLVTAARIPLHLPYGTLASAASGPPGRDPGARSLTGWCEAWVTGDASTWEYLLALNAAAGRRPRDRLYHVMMPWVLDMSTTPEDLMAVRDSPQQTPPGWRDLRRTKWRLAKGDEQLDASYARSHPAHHVNDEPLSELAVCIYTARRLPVALLQRVVRSVWEPGEYPATMERLYAWTPDEAIPEFFCDPEVFASTHVHMGMPDLAPPKWARDTPDFVTRHRAALESDSVSAALHTWIDLSFGCALTGAAAIAAKNVALPPADPAALRAGGRAQLFTAPHPARRVRGTASRSHDLTTVTTSDKIASSGASAASDATLPPGTAPLPLPLQLLRADVDATARMAAAIRAAVSPRAAGTGAGAAAAMSAFALDPLGSATPFAAHMRAVTTGAAQGPGAFSAAIEALEAVAAHSITAASENLFSAMSLSAVLPSGATTAAPSSSASQSGSAASTSVLPSLVSLRVSMIGGAAKTGAQPAPSNAVSIGGGVHDEGEPDEEMEMLEVVRDTDQMAAAETRDVATPVVSDATHPLDVDFAAIGRLIVALWADMGLDAFWESPGALAAALPRLPPGFATLAAALLRIPWAGVTPPPRVRSLREEVLSPTGRHSPFNRQLVAAAHMLHRFMQTPQHAAHARLRCAAVLVTGSTARPAGTSLRALGEAGAVLVLPQLVQCINAAVEECPEGSAVSSSPVTTPSPPAVQDDVLTVLRACACACATDAAATAAIVACLQRLGDHSAFSAAACDAELHSNLRVALGTASYAVTVLPLLLQRGGTRGAHVDKVTVLSPILVQFATSAPLPLTLNALLRPLLDELLSGGGGAHAVASTASCFGSVASAINNKAAVAKHVLPPVLRSLDAITVSLATSSEVNGADGNSPGVGAGPQAFTLSASPTAPTPPTMPVVPTASTGSAKRLAALQAAAAAAVALRDALERGPLGGGGGASSTDGNAMATTAASSTMPTVKPVRTGVLASEQSYADARLLGGLHAVIALCPSLPQQVLSDTLLRAPVQGDMVPGAAAGGLEGGSHSPRAVGRLVASGGAAQGPNTASPLLRLLLSPATPWTARLSAATALVTALRAVGGTQQAETPPGLSGQDASSSSASVVQSAHANALLTFLRPLFDAAAAARQRTPSAGVSIAPPEIDLLMALLPPFVDILGLAGVRACLPCALLLERKLMTHTQWLPPTPQRGLGSTPATPLARGSTEQQNMLLLSDRDRQAARALEGLHRWSSSSLGPSLGGSTPGGRTLPDSTAGGAPSTASSNAGGSTKEASNASSAGGPSAWWWLPTAWADETSPSAAPPPSWGLHMRIVHEWRAALPGGGAGTPSTTAGTSACALRGVLASPDEALCLTVGADALRLWPLNLGAPAATTLASSSRGVAPPSTLMGPPLCEYYGHPRGATPVAAVMLHAPALVTPPAALDDEGEEEEEDQWCMWVQAAGNSPAFTVVASVDTRGGIHVWRAHTAGRLATLAEPGSGVASSGTSISGDPSSRCFTSLVALDAGCGSTLIAGLQDGRVRAIDAATGRLMSAWSCCPQTGSAGGGAPAPAVRCLAQLGVGAMAQQHVVAAALSNGSVALVDIRSGRLAASWRTHDGSVSCCAPLHCSSGAPFLLTGSSDRSLALWDLRRCVAGRASGAPTTGLAGHASASALVTWTGHKDGVACVAACAGGECVLSTAAGRVAQFSCCDVVLASSTSMASASSTALPPPSAEMTSDVGGGSAITRALAPGRLMRSGAAGAASKEKALIAGICLLPSSRAAVVAAHDGIVRLCV